MTFYDLKSKKNYPTTFSIHNKYFTNPPHELNTTGVTFVSMTSYELKSKNIIQHSSIHNKFLINPPHKLNTTQELYFLA
jgi:hypothetical protein